MTQRLTGAHVALLALVCVAVLSLVGCGGDGGSSGSASNNGVIPGGEIPGGVVPTDDVPYTPPAGTDFQPVAVTPEPATIILVAAGIAGAAAVSRKRRSR